MYEFDFTNKVILVIGASRGIGFAIAKALADNGGKVMMVAQSDKITESSEKISKSNNRITFPYKANISNYEEVVKLVEFTIKKFGKIDVLINCAAIIGPTGALDKSDPLHWAETINVNLVGAYNIMRVVLSHMKMLGYGSIVNFSGGGAANPSPNFSAYGCSKAAVVRLTETLSHELINTGIRVNVIAPGANDTDMYKIFVKAGGVARTLVTIDQPVKLALFLASNKSVGITGKFIHVFDDYESIISNKTNVDLFTLRRVE
jgi:NAD(P)-dependent dehydrogenase (short-subunit alcohol dehydrogenase family)